MRIKIEISEIALKELILTHLRERLGSIVVNEKAVRIEVKSKQNYSSEWEPAAFRATYEAEG